MFFPLPADARSRTAQAWLIALFCAAVTPSASFAQRLAEWDEDATPTHPEDPFWNHYQVPYEKETGATAGQFRMIGSMMLVPTRAGIEPGLHGTLELMTYAYLSVRGSLQTTLAAAGGEPVPVFAAKAGPSLHLLPYRRVDLSLFFEGGVAVVSATKPEHAPMAIASPGATLELWLSHWALLRLEGHVDCGSYAERGLAHRYVRLGTLFGLGIAL